MQGRGPFTYVDPRYLETLIFTQLLLLLTSYVNGPLRVLNTVGVARGLGDHDLLAKYSGVKCKEFLTPQPEVNLVT